MKVQYISYNLKTNCIQKDIMYKNLNLKNLNFSLHHGWQRQADNAQKIKRFPKK